MSVLWYFMLREWDTCKLHLSLTCNTSTCNNTDGNKHGIFSAIALYCVIIHNPQITHLQSSNTYSRMNNTVSSLFVFWFHINSEVETVLFQVLSSISRVSYLIITDNDSGVYISQVAPCDLELLTSFQVTLTMPIKKL